MPVTLSMTGTTVVGMAGCSMLGSFTSSTFREVLILPLEGSITKAKSQAGTVPTPMAPTQVLRPLTNERFARCFRTHAVTRVRVFRARPMGRSGDRHPTRDSSRGWGARPGWNCRASRFLREKIRLSVLFVSGLGGPHEFPPGLVAL